MGNDGSIDWLGFPRFDSEACFAALLGTPDNGRWLIAPKEKPTRVNRRYRDGTLILETDFETPDGAITLTDCMQRRDSHSDVLRVVRGKRGRVPMRMELRIRFGYGELTLWVTRLADERLRTVAGRDQLVLQTAVATRGENLTTVADFLIREGDEMAFSLTWDYSFRPTPSSPDVSASIKEIEEEWKRWSARCTVSGEYAEPVLRSLITLRALEDFDTGGIVAAVTASLPETIGGERN